MSFFKNIFEKRKEQSRQRHAELSRKVKDLSDEADVLLKEADELMAARQAKRKRKAR